MADDEIPSYWTIKLEKVERITSDDPGDDDIMFAVDFTAVGMGLNADFGVLVNDMEDEGQVVAAALDTLREGLLTWAQVIERRKKVKPTGPKGGRRAKGGV